MDVLCATSHQSNIKSLSQKRERDDRKGDMLRDGCQQIKNIVSYICKKIPGTRRLVPK